MNRRYSKILGKLFKDKNTIYQVIDTGKNIKRYRYSLYKQERYGWSHNRNVGYYKLRKYYKPILRKGEIWKFVGETDISQFPDKVKITNELRKNHKDLVYVEHPTQGAFTSFSPYVRREIFVSRYIPI